jgi:hypothetical protein
MRTRSQGKDKKEKKKFDLLANLLDEQDENDEQK